MDMDHDNLEQLHQKKWKSRLQSKLRSFLKSTCAKQNKNRTTMLLKDEED